eukprot:CAMPEP_0197053112 /NCGR_PEP_ID=MMETSP1384-20130603/27458_1 /TAXON_ID=29189 /ORGANISM="Ammonia sp." /LENGTH=72 /DNA_ID=CAMNT_0042485959 /DNA_START=18 /DNA_END=233 /DNA_ORIENTATION=+
MTVTDTADKQSEEVAKTESNAFTDTDTETKDANTNKPGNQSGFGHLHLFNLIANSKSKTDVTESNGTKVAEQ